MEYHSEKFENKNHIGHVALGYSRALSRYGQEGLRIQLMVEHWPACVRSWV
jgi:hypothetical protein